MPQLIINIPTSEVAQRIANAFIALYNYAGENTPAAKAEFVRQQLIKFMRDKVEEYEVQLAEQQARIQPDPEVE